MLHSFLLKRIKSLYHLGQIISFLAKVMGDLSSFKSMHHHLPKLILIIKHGLWLAIKKLFITLLFVLTTRECSYSPTLFSLPYPSHSRISSWYFMWQLYIPVAVRLHFQNDCLSFNFQRTDDIYVSSKFPKVTLSLYLKIMTLKHPISLFI